MDEARRDTETQTQEVVRHIRMFTWLECSQVGQLVKCTVSDWVDDKAPRLGAALAFYAALSIAPLVIVTLAISGLAFGTQAAQGQLFWQISSLVGPQGAQAVQAIMVAAHRPANGVLATVLGLITLLFGASSVVVELTDALNTIWHIPVDPRQSGMMSVFRIVRQRFLSFAMIVGVGFLLLISLFVNAWISALGKYFEQKLPASEPLLQSFNFVLSFLVITFLFAVIYKVLPDVHLKWSDVAIGAAATSLLFTLGKFLIGFYLGKASFASSYGAAGSFLVILVWVYYSAQIFFLGAEFTKVYTKQFGSEFRSQLQVTPEKLQPNLIIDPSKVDEKPDAKIELSSSPRNEDSKLIVEPSRGQR